jgi:hypothetical protein
MIVGFTGTRRGMSEQQKIGTKAILLAIGCFQPIAYGLHGDCLGADADFDAICKELNIPTKIRPCTYTHMRANCDAPEVAEALPPMQRNRLIVADSDVMIANPPSESKLKHGGTWATVGFSRRDSKKLFIVTPVGTVSYGGGS